MAGCLKPGGALIFTSFSKAQLGRTSGGPPNLEWLHDLEEVRNEFPGVEIEHAIEHEVELNEGVGHVGPAMVIEMLGAKA